ncbi:MULTISPECIES: DUF4236 domain-containing protein [Actinomadura]|uniref:DUF4236 domain-containing protein n=1 Tax=Actinomadura miaoliensis TaxID=430685 RepID=A0ABP7WU25_9ACTN
MGWGYRKSLRIGPFRINLSRSGVGHSVGGRGVRYTRTAHGRREMTFRIPGTGLYWRRPLSRRRPRTRRH